MDWKDTSNFLITRKHNNLGGLESMTFEWVGESPYIYIGISDIYDWRGFIEYSPTLDLLKVGGYTLVRIENTGFSTLYIKKSGFWRFRVWVYKVTRLLDLVYRRLLYTLAVWNLADFPQGTIPSWKDIKLFRKRK